MDQERIGNLIKEIRKDNNLTQAELGDSLGVTAQAVSKWENSKNIPDIAVLKEISDNKSNNVPRSKKLYDDVIQETKAKWLDEPYK